MSVISLLLMVNIIDSYQFNRNCWLWPWSACTRKFLSYEILVPHVSIQKLMVLHIVISLDVCAQCIRFLTCFFYLIQRIQLYNWLCLYCKYQCICLLFRLYMLNKNSSVLIKIFIDSLLWWDKSLRDKLFHRFNNYVIIF